MFLVYGGGPDLTITSYSDASFHTDKHDLKSQSGYVFIMNGGEVIWRSSKQDTTADFTIEAEYIAASEDVKEVVWTQKFIGELGVVPSVAGPITVYCDSTSAIEQTKRPKSHNRSKHIFRKYHIIREFVDRQEIAIEKIPTKDNVANPPTKSLV